MIIFELKGVTCIDSGVQAELPARRQIKSTKRREARLAKMRKHNISKRQSETAEQREARLAKERERRVSRKRASSQKQSERKSKCSHIQLKEELPVL